MNNLSKSRYCTGIRCLKELWLSCYKKEEAKEDNTQVLENGTRVGELARSLLGEDYINIEYNNDKRIMLEETKKHLVNKPNIICEASFSYDNNFCSVDILKNDKDGVEIYEVKSSTSISGINIDDISYQTWVLKKCGLNVKKSYLVHINNKYVKKGKLDINKLFTIEDVTELLDENIEEKVKVFKEVLSSNKEPNIDISECCNKSKKIPYDCPFFAYCTRNLPTPNVFDIGWNTSFTKKLELYNRNKIIFKDIFPLNELNQKAQTQVDYALHNLKPKINKEAIEELLSTFTYPLYFLDFESYQQAIPEIDGTVPYQQICFQYSLHYYLKEDGELYHKEFLSDDYNGNPMYGLCKRLCEDIPKNSCVLVYNQSFEITRLEEMAEMFPEFRDHLLNIVENIKDLLPPFRNQDYYVKEIGGSASIKKVLPALDKTLNYNELDEIHKGDEASNAFITLKDKSDEEKKTTRHNLLKYCEMDTYAMVIIYQKLKEMI